MGAVFPAGKGGCGGAVGRFDRGAAAGRGALLVANMAGTALCCRGSWRPSGAFTGLRLAKSVALVKRW